MKRVPEKLAYQDTELSLMREWENHLIYKIENKKMKIILYGFVCAEDFPFRMENEEIVKVQDFDPLVGIFTDTFEYYEDASDELDTWMFDICSQR